MRRTAPIRTYDLYTMGTTLRCAETPNSARSGDDDNDAAGHHSKRYLARTAKTLTHLFLAIPIAQPRLRYTIPDTGSHLAP